MANPVLGNVTLPVPNGFTDTNEPKGVITQTLDGTKRRNIHAIKHIYTLNFTNLSASDYSNILGEYNLETERIFIWSDFSISTTVLIDISQRDVMPGRSDFYSNLVLTLQEV